jgi:hypothetical protein
MPVAYLRSAAFVFSRSFRTKYILDPKHQPNHDTNHTMSSPSEVPQPTFLHVQDIVFFRHIVNCDSYT